MDFEGDFGLWQRRIAEGQEGSARRIAVAQSLALKSGQAVLDLGCGGGQLLRDIALAVGDRGRAVGLDASAEQVSAAARHCEGLAAVELLEGDATDLPFDDASFDSIASIQMFEYVEDVDTALQQARRVLKGGGKAALVSVLWDHWQFHGAEAGLNQRVHDAWRAHCRHQMLPLELPRKLEAVGFRGVEQRPLTIFNAELHENAFAFWAARLIARFAEDNGVGKADAERWLAQIEEADRQGRFGFVSVPVLTSAVAI